jgi:hypothetical protein
MTPNSAGEILVRNYESMLLSHGDTAHGANWPNETDRRIRFDVMLDVIVDVTDAPVVLCDLGCGTGELLAHIRSRGLCNIVTYVGCDRSAVALSYARAKFPDATFLEIDVNSPEADLGQIACDFLIANGLFTVKWELSDDQMWSFLTSTISRVWPIVRGGIAFNVMSKIEDWTRDDLFHLAMDDAARFLHALAGRRVRFRADYGLYEYTAFAYKPVEESTKSVPVLRPQLPRSGELLPHLRRIDSTRVYSNHGPIQLKLCGASPKHLLPASPGNPEGHFESVPLMRFHDELLASAGSRWHDWRKFNPAWYRSPPAYTFKQRAKEIFEAEFGKAPLPILKDPRICRFAPFWIDVLKEIGATPRMVIPIRSPLEVALSLKKRDSMSLAKGLLLWLRHVLDAELATRSNPRSIFSWSGLLSDWRRISDKICLDTGLSWPRLSECSAQEVEQFLSCEMVHHKTQPAELIAHSDVNDWTILTYEALTELMRDPSSNSASERLDEIREQFDKSCAVFGRVLIEDQTLESVKRERDFLRSVIRTAWARHRPAEKTGGFLGISTEQQDIDDADLVHRIISAFRKANETPLGSSDSIWIDPGQIAGIRKAEYQTMMKGSHADITKMLRNPLQTHLFYGFDDLVASRSHDPSWQEWMRQWDYDCLVRLAEAVGTVRLENPEAGPRDTKIRDVEDLLNGLDGAFGFKIQFPNVYPEEVGVVTARGVASFRAIQALFQAWRIFEIVGKRPSANVLEIGAGLGRTAYFARQFGIENYTIIDIPLTGVAQAYFLGRVVGADALRLFGEASGGPLAILPPARFFETEDRYDLIVNVDSMTEMAASTAQAYWRAISMRTPVFLSINHEFQRFTVRDVISSTPGLEVRRTPYWLRRGYVEEVVLTGIVQGQHT